MINKLGGITGALKRAWDYLETLEYYPKGYKDLKYAHVPEKVNMIIGFEIGFGGVYRMNMWLAAIGAGLVFGGRALPYVTSYLCRREQQKDCGRK